MRSQIISIIGKLLGGEKIDVHGIKQLMVSRFTGLFANPEWIKFGNIELRKMIAITEFINKTNRR
jgi:CRISPR-associated protein Csh1